MPESGKEMASVCASTCDARLVMAAIGARDQRDRTVQCRAQPDDRRNTLNWLELTVDHTVSASSMCSIVNALKPQTQLPSSCSPSLELPSCFLPPSRQRRQTNKR